MNNSNNVYEVFKKTLIEKMSLERDKLVMCDTLNSRYTNLFEITNENDRLYKRILDSLNRLAQIQTESLIADLCRKYDRKAKCNNESNFIPYDVIAEYQGETYFIDVKTSPEILFRQPQALERFTRGVKNCKGKVLLIFLIKEAPELKDIKCLEDIPNLTILSFEQFLKTFFGDEELKLFNKAMLTYKEDMHNAMGYQITEIFNDRNLQKLKEDLIKCFNIFDYKAIKRRALNEITSGKSDFKDLYDHSFEDITKTFLNERRYEPLFDGNNFGKSFLTSEWLYRQHIGSKELDNTFIVAGYLKSIEQLLTYIAFKKGKGRKMTLFSAKEEITIDDEYIDATLGDLEYFFSNYDNLDIFDNADKFFVRYLREHLRSWRDRYRNGYFHKHSLENIDKVNEIREETFFLYCLILGSIRIS